MIRKQHSSKESNFEHRNVVSHSECTFGNNLITSNIIYTLMLCQHRPMLRARCENRISCAS